MAIKSRSLGAFLLSALLLQGCSTVYTWVKPGEPKADYSEDLYNCTSEANRSGSVFNSTDYRAPPVISESPFSNAGCYNPSVSDVNCLSTTPQSSIPQTFNSQLGESSYQIFVDRCMKAKGWKKEAKD